MFQEASEKLRLEEVATILDRINPELEGVEFDPVNTVIMGVDVPFYKGYKFLEIEDYSGGTPVQRFVLYSPAKFHILDFTNLPIYTLNKELPIQLNEDNVASYVRFFFTYVRGRHGRFLICENVDDIAWKDTPPPSARKTIGKMLKSLDVDVKENGSYHMLGTMVFKDSLFKSDITVTPDGFVSLTDEELLIENMPVLDDIFGE